MRILALYLPQFHTFKENDEWWGEGYTEWTAVRRAKPCYKGHVQPRVPLDDIYYDLDKDGAATLKKQAELAKKYGIYGISIYQYYFKGKLLMEKPMETLLAHPEIDLNYCICWANESWTRTWYGLENEVLMKQEYGDESDFRAHFDYLLKFFKDERYIKVDNRPMLQIYRTFEIEKLAKMRSLFDEWAKEEGFDGIFLVSGKTAGQIDNRCDVIDAYYTFEPGYSLKHCLSAFNTFRYNFSVLFRTLLNKVRKNKLLERRLPIKWIYKAITERDYAEDEFPGVIARWDNTPRRAHKGLVYTGASPERFETALLALRSKVQGRKNDFVMLNAFNEWGEGAMIEPDKQEGMAYLEAIRKVVDTLDE